METRIITYEEALTEYQSLLNDDLDFKKQWSNTLKNFYEWCSFYDDLKHIKLNYEKKQNKIRKRTS